MSDNLFDMMQADIANGLGGEAAKPADVLHDPDDDWMARAESFAQSLPSNLTSGDPRPHQVLALGEAGLGREHAYWIDAGGGKTYTCIYEAGALHEMDKIDGLIVVAPNGPHRQWITQELPKWARFPWHGTYRGAHKTTKHGEVYASNKFFDSGRVDKLGVIALNYEGMGTKEAKAWVQHIVQRYPRFMLIVDESQKVKGTTASRTHLTNALARRAAYRRTLSGTPLLKGLEDLFSQYFILKPGVTGPFSLTDIEDNWRAARNFYCRMVPVEGANNPRSHVKKWAKRIDGYRNEALFRERVRPISTRITEDMFGKETGADFIPYDVEMTGPQKAAYLTMKEMMLAQIESGVVTAQNALVQLAKLRQLASGFIYDEDRNVEWISLSKIEATKTILEGISGDCIVWAPDIPMLDKLEEELSKDFSKVYRYRELTDVDRWKETGGIMIGNQGSGLGVGMNLQNAAANIYVSNSFSSEARWQSLKRTDRMGQTKQVRNWDLMTRGTVDHKVMANLQKKKDIATMNVDGIKDIAL